MTPITITLDIVLIMTSAAAVLYCAVLARRLRALHDLRSGIGEAIVSLSKQIKLSEEANERIARDARAAIEDLDTAVAAVQDHRQMAEDILETLDGQVARARGRLSQSLKASEDVAGNLSALTERSRLELKALRRGLEIACRVNTLQRKVPTVDEVKDAGAQKRRAGDAPTEDVLGEDAPTPAQTKETAPKRVDPVVPLRDTARPMRQAPNPFLQARAG